LEGKASWPVAEAGGQEDAEGALCEHCGPMERAMVDGCGQRCRCVDQALERIPDIVGGDGEGVGVGGQCGR
jgi:hypothetical protein